jgi:hypothetical protein
VFFNCTGYIAPNGRLSVNEETGSKRKEATMANPKNIIPELFYKYWRKPQRLYSECIT